MIRSTLGKTAYPYALYIKSLDLRNFASLLDDPTFRDAVYSGFFAGDMAKFLGVNPIKTRKKELSQKRLDVRLILERVGDAITRYVRFVAFPFSSAF